MLLPDLQNSHWQILDSSVWAKKCLVISKDGINFSKDEANKHLDSLVVFALYFSEDEEQKLKLRNIGDPTMQFTHAFH
ncbi:hypothetical protein BD408DRAFT_407834 [Parasitella parasitica]|nr:hypothetical protein BD408DRAFT_407834 [Parasitella parasitica]